MSDDDPYVHGVVEFLDKRWTRAEADAYLARRSVLLLSGVAIACSTIILSLAAAVAGFVTLVLLAHSFVDAETCSAAAAALLVAVGAGPLVLAIRRLAGGRRRP